MGRLLTLPDAVTELEGLLDGRSARDGEYVIVNAADDVNYFVQIAFHADHVYAEAVGNHYISDERDWLGETQLAKLEVMGWEPPAAAPAASHYNHSRSFPAATSSLEIARALLDTLVVVYARGAGEGAAVRLTHSAFYKFTPK